MLCTANYRNCTAESQIAYGVPSGTILARRMARTLPLTDHGRFEQNSCVLEYGRSVSGVARLSPVGCDSAMDECVR